MKDPETDRLVSELDDLESYDGWRFTYEYPGYFCYSRPDLPFLVFFTPDWQDDGKLPIEVQDDDGGHFEEHSSVWDLPHDGRTGKQIFDLVRPTLDKLGKLPPPAEPTITVHVSLTAKEISALKAAHEHVRVHMAHEHPWEVRDAAMVGISKVLSAAETAKESPQDKITVLAEAPKTPETPEEREDFLARWDPPLCVQCSKQLTEAELANPRNNGDYDESCDACAAQTQRSR